MVVISLILSIFLIIYLTTKVHVHPFLALFVAALFFGITTGMTLEQIIISVNDGFKETIGKTGLIILFGVIIGAFLENSGAAYILTDKLLALIGKKRTTAAMACIGYFISIPVFADSGYLLVSPLNKSLCKRTGSSYTAAALALAFGLITSHTMVPPTPGPVAAAGILGADLGLLLLIGIPISALSLIPPILYAQYYVARTNIDPGSDFSEIEWQEKVKAAPGPVKSSLPVLIPIVLIVLKSVSPAFENNLPQNIYRLVLFLGEPFMALFIGLLFSLLLPKKFTFHTLSTEGWVGKALRDSAIIILITGAGGIFGKILQTSEISTVTAEAIENINIGIWLPFLLAAVIKTAQGSSTVAMITAASIVSPLMMSLGFITPVDKVLVVLAIGAGSAVVCHANDSFFWVVTQLSGIPVNKGFRLFTPGTAVVGFSAASIIFITYLFTH
jgi:gluconate:H+ symporter, GntP family